MVVAARLGRPLQSWSTPPLSLVRGCSFTRSYANSVAKLIIFSLMQNLDPSNSLCSFDCQKLGVLIIISLIWMRQRVSNPMPAGLVQQIVYISHDISAPAKAPSPLTKGSMTLFMNTLLRVILSYIPLQLVPSYYLNVWYFVLEPEPILSVIIVENYWKFNLWLSLLGSPFSNTASSRSVGSQPHWRIACPIWEIVMKPRLPKSHSANTFFTSSIFSSFSGSTSTI